VSDRWLINIAIVSRDWIASNGMRESGARLAKMAFAILWSDTRYSQHDVKICDLLYMGRQHRKSLREVGHW
jgi:hypothetical protein